jgi:hypothetical protein
MFVKKGNVTLEDNMFGFFTTTVDYIFYSMSSALGSLKTKDATM